MPFFSTVTLTVDQLGCRRRAVRSVPSRSFRLRGIKILVAAPDAPVGERVREEPEDPVALGALGGAVERLRRRRAGGLVAQSPPTRPLSSSAATPRCPISTVGNLLSAPIFTYPGEDPAVHHLRGIHGNPSGFTSEISYHPSVPHRSDGAAPTIPRADRRQLGGPPTRVLDRPSAALLPRKPTKYSV